MQYNKNQNELVSRDLVKLISCFINPDEFNFRLEKHWPSEQLNL